MELLLGLIFLFFGSLGAWMKGDDSMSWFVILCIVVVVVGALFGSCSN